MNPKLFLCAGLVALGGVADAQLEARPEAIGPLSEFVPVDLNALANAQNDLDAPDAQVTFNKIPFDLARSGEKNNLFLKNAGWSDWATDARKADTYDDVPKEPTDTLPVARIPVDDYSAVYVLASCENDPAFSNVLTLRIGAKRGRLQVTYHDFEFEIPRAGQKTGANVIKALPTPNAGVFLLRLPLNAALAQEFANHRALDVEITKQLRLRVSKPDAARYQYRPLGLPSGVHIYGMTFERAPLRLFWEASQIGHVFNEPEVPTFALRLEQMDEGRIRNLAVRAKVVDLEGNTREFPVTEDAAFANSLNTNLKLPVTKRGYYALTVMVESNGKLLLERQTTFALLPKDTRTHRASSPFGTWDFSGAHFTPNDADVIGALYVKAGLRYGMFGFSPAERARYGIIKGNDPKVNSRNITDPDKLDKLIAEVKASGETPTMWMLFHEDALSGNHITRTPDLFTGSKYQLSADEEKKYAEMVALIETTVPKVRAAFPGIRFTLGNGNSPLMEEFLRRKLSPDLFDVLGNEAASFQRSPESQPLDPIANNSSLWMQNELLKAYGYGDKKVEQVYEIIYPSSNPGNLTLRDQANYTVRNVMHSLAWGVPRIRFQGIVDPGNNYHFSNWGAIGLMFGQPDLSPKPLYVATATMTQQLDGAQFSRVVPTGTTTVYAFEFKKPNGEYVTCVWTPTTPREVKFGAPQSLTVTDLMANSQVMPAATQLMATPAPVFIVSAQPLQLLAGATVETNALPAKRAVIAALDDAAQWQVINKENNELEAYNFMQPRRQGNFAVQTIAEFEGKAKPLEVKPLGLDTKNWWLPQYTQLRAKTPIPIEGQPTHIGLSVNGNGGWGRVVFELEDAAGQRWISLGAEQKGEPSPWLADFLTKDEFEKLSASGGGSSGISDWNTNDVWSRSDIDFAGWNTLSFPLPGNYPGENYHWPYTSQWRCVKADGARGDYVVHYPLKLTKLAITARAQVLYGPRVEPVRRPEIYLKDLMVAYGDPDTAFWKPDVGQK